MGPCHSEKDSPLQQGLREYLSNQDNNNNEIEHIHQYH